LSEEEIKRRLLKIELQTDVQYLKAGDDNFEPLAREHIFKFSEVDLEHEEARGILLKLLELVERKSSGVISELSAESIDSLAGISIDDLLQILSISKEAYLRLIEGGDLKAIRSASIIQRALVGSGANNELIEFCSRRKSEWDRWLMCNRHILPEMELMTIISSVATILQGATVNGQAINIASLKKPIEKLVSRLKKDNILYDLTEELILGGIFSELTRAKS
jgi:hypothetical protein